MGRLSHVRFEVGERWEVLRHEIRPFEIVSGCREHMKAIDLPFHTERLRRIRVGCIFAGSRRRRNFRSASRASIRDGEVQGYFSGD